MLVEQWDSKQKHPTVKPHTSRAQMLTKYNWPEQNAVSGDVGHDCDRTLLCFLKEKGQTESPRRVEPNPKMFVKV